MLSRGSRKSLRRTKCCRTVRGHGAVLCVPLPLELLILGCPATGLTQVASVDIPRCSGSLQSYCLACGAWLPPCTSPETVFGRCWRAGLQDEVSPVGLRLVPPHPMSQLRFGSSAGAAGAHANPPPFAVLYFPWLGHHWCSCLCLAASSPQPPFFSFQSRSAISMTVMARTDSWGQVSG